MNNTLLIGLLTGVCFGIFLQKARITRVGKVLGALRLEDMTVLKFLLAAVLVGSVGVRVLHDTGLIELSHKPMNVGGVFPGAIIFGIGLPFLLFCPGTAGGAFAEGRWHAIFGILGMLTGGGIFACVYPYLKPTVLAWKNYGNIGLAEATGISSWVFIAVLWASAIPLFVWLEKKKL